MGVPAKSNKGRGMLHPTMNALPSKMEKELSWLFALTPVFGIMLGVYYLKFPPGWRTLARQCMLVSTATTIIAVVMMYLRVG
jgi:hypothetical protein